MCDEDTLIYKIIKPYYNQSLNYAHFAHISDRAKYILQTGRKLL